VIAESGSHVFNYETGGAALLSSVQIHTIEGLHGRLTVEQIRRAVRPPIYYMPRSSLICLENTHNRAGGTIYPISLLKEISAFALAMRIRLHLDGARLWNASVASGVSPAEYASCVDSVSVCLSKGLGAPVGSVIAGSRGFIEEARHYRKIFGGGMRQAGILAAAGLYALDHNIDRLREDHAKAAYLAGELASIAGLDLDRETVQTNIIMFSIEKSGKSTAEFLANLQEQGVLLTPGGYAVLRAVTHLDVSMDQVKRAAAVIREVMR
jgi:threonine aldolase